MAETVSCVTVSYTHLDVYKRQEVSFFGAVCFRFLRLAYPLDLNGSNCLLYTSEYGVPYNTLSGEVRAAISDLAGLKYEVLKKVGDAVGNTQAYQL